MVSKGTWHKTSTQNLRVFWCFWVLITLTSTLNPICPVLRYPCGKQFFSTEYPSNEIYFPDKKPYSGDFQYKKSHMGRNGQKLTKFVKRRGDFIIASTVFLPDGLFLLPSRTLKSYLWAVILVPLELSPFDLAEVQPFMIQKICFISKCSEICTY